MLEHHKEVPTRDKVLVVGAGPAGLAAAAALKALKVPFDLVDKAKHVGGIWYTERPDTPVWRSMQMVSSTKYTQYEDMLQPVSYPAYLSGDQMGKYLRAYAARYSLTDEFHGGLEVRRAQPYGPGEWQVEFSSGHITVYRGIISAHGTSEKPYLPQWAHELPASVQALHAKDWQGCDGLEGKRVLVVGSGQSAADIAVDAARRALEVRWAPRSGHWIVPRMIGPVPGDVAAAREPGFLGGLNARIANTVVARMAGNPADVGLPEPNAPANRDAVIVSDALMDRIKEGRISVVGEVTGLTAEGTVRGDRTDGYRPDVVVFATGYQPSADYLPSTVVPTTASGSPDLFLGAFPRTREDLVMLGQLRVAGGILPVLVQQADIAAYLMHALVHKPRAVEAFTGQRDRGGSSRSLVIDAPHGQSRSAEDMAGGAPARGTLPFMDRAELLAQLAQVRAIFE